MVVIDSKVKLFLIILLYCVIIFVIALHYLKYRFVNEVRKEVTKKPGYKLILLWNPFFSNAGYYFGLSENVFEEKGCLESRCMVTVDRSYPFDLYDSVIFHQMSSSDALVASSQRTNEQVFVYVNLESPLNTHSISEMKGFYNLTISYDLEADIIWSYFAFINDRGEYVAPSLNPDWLIPLNKNMNNITLRNVVKGKKKKVAWFVSNCKPHNNRNEYVRELERYVEVDVFGKCGNKQCDRNTPEKCFAMMGKQYLFYLAFENSNCVDYVTEKVQQAMDYDAVPIVFGGANYSRFLPPHSYIDASTLTPADLALKINFYANNLAYYEMLFWWRNHYSIEVGKYLNYSVHPFCELCRILHDKKHIYRNYNDLNNLIGVQRSKCKE